MNGIARRPVLLALGLSLALSACRSTAEQASYAPESSQIAQSVPADPKIIQRPSSDVQRRNLRLSRGGGRSC